MDTNEELNEVLWLLRQVPDAVGYAYACWDPTAGIPEVDAYLVKVEAILRELAAEPMSIEEATAIEQDIAAAQSG